MQNTFLKSFETFIREPLSILRGKIVNVVNLENQYSKESEVKIDLMSNAIQVNVVNSERVYNLLSTVLYKKKLNRMRKIGMKIGNKKD